MFPPLQPEALEPRVLQQTPQQFVSERTQVALRFRCVCALSATCPCCNTVGPLAACPSVATLCAEPPRSALLAVHHALFFVLLACGLWLGPR